MKNYIIFQKMILDAIAGATWHLFEILSDSILQKIHFRYFYVFVYIIPLSDSIFVYMYARIHFSIHFQFHFSIHFALYLWFRFYFKIPPNPWNLPTPIPPPCLSCPNILKAAFLIQSGILFLIHFGFYFWFKFLDSIFDTNS